MSLILDSILEGIVYLTAKADRSPEYLRELRITRDRFPALQVVSNEPVVVIDISDMANYTNPA
jgi:hypothetical protein